MRLLPLVAATFFMVSGGPYGMEDILGGAGFAWAIVILLVLAACLEPAHGADDRRAGQPPSPPKAAFTSGCAARWARSGATRRAGCRSPPASSTWRFIPTIFVLYLGKFSPALTTPSRDYLWSLAVVVLCCAWNLRGAPRVGEDSVWMSALLLAPFAVFFILCFWHGLTWHPVMHWGRPSGGSDAGLGLSTAILVALWNYMGWDNASTVARDVENPQRNYPRAMIGAAALTAVSYVLPVTAMAVAGFSPDGFTTGSWAVAGRAIGGPLLAMAVVAGGVICGVGHVQRADDELYPPAHRHGRRRHAAAHLRTPQ